MTISTESRVRLAKTQISLSIRPVWSESSLCALRAAKDPVLLHADNEDSDQTGQVSSLDAYVNLFVLSCAGSSHFLQKPDDTDIDNRGDLYAEKETSW